MEPLRPLGKASHPIPGLEGRQNVARLKRWQMHTGQHRICLLLEHLEKWKLREGSTNLWIMAKTTDLKLLGLGLWLRGWCTDTCILKGMKWNPETRLDWKVENKSSVSFFCVWYWGSNLGPRACEGQKSTVNFNKGRLGSYEWQDAAVNERQLGYNWCTIRHYNLEIRREERGEP